MKGRDAMVSMLKRAAGGDSPAGKDGAMASAGDKKPADDEDESAKREELKTAVMEFKSAEDPDAALDAFLALMELCKGYEAE